MIVHFHSLIKNFLQTICIAGTMSYSGIAEDTLRIRIITEIGNIEAELYPEKAPLTVANFLANIKAGLYADGHFYRAARPDNQTSNTGVMTLIQGGKRENSNTLPAVSHEPTNLTGLSHVKGILSMANLGYGTATSEFFITLGDNRFLDYQDNEKQGYAAFGAIINGYQVAMSILKKPTGNRSLSTQEQQMVSTTAYEWILPQLLNDSVKIFQIEVLE